MAAVSSNIEMTLMSNTFIVQSPSSNEELDTWLS
jgi:hypothetical protein